MCDSVVEPFQKKSNKLEDMNCMCSNFKKWNNAKSVSEEFYNKGTQMITWHDGCQKCFYLIMHKSSLTASTCFGLNNDTKYAAV